MHDRPNDRFQDRLALARHRSIPEAQDAKLLRLQKRCALLVVVGALEMLAAVQLDDQPASQAAEVGDIRTNWNLASKARSGNPSAAKVLP
jgi:hypothetical protein